jgi:hypothetical protein
MKTLKNIVTTEKLAIKWKYISDQLRKVFFRHSNKHGIYALYIVLL